MWVLGELSEKKQPWQNIVASCTTTFFHHSICSGRATVAQFYHRQQATHIHSHSEHLWSRILSPLKKKENQSEIPSKWSELNPWTLNPQILDTSHLNGTSRNGPPATLTNLRLERGARHLKSRIRQIRPSVEKSSRWWSPSHQLRDLVMLMLFENQLRLLLIMLLGIAPHCEHTATLC